MSELPMSGNDCADVIIPVIKQALEPIQQQVRHLTQAAQRLAPLEQRVGELETKAVAGCQWRGVYQADVAYAPGELTTKSGSLWLATRATSAAPGTEDCGWTLIVKAGAFGVRGAA
jgi:hypothetical protein